MRKLKNTPTQTKPELKAAESATEAPSIPKRKQPPIAGARGFAVDQFASLYGIGSTTAYAEIKSGRLKARKCGDRTLILTADAEEWAQSLPLASNA